MAKFKYNPPLFLKNSESVESMQTIVAELNARRPITKADALLLNMLASSWDLFWSATKWIIENDMIQVNKKGEEVTHPMVNIRKAHHTQILEILKEFGLTEKSSTKVKKPTKEDDKAPITKFLPR